MNYIQLLSIGVITLVTLLSAVSSADPPTYIVKDKNETSKTCLMMQALISVNIVYTDNITNTTQHVNSTIPTDDNTTSDGTCGKMRDTLILAWKDGRNDLELTFFFNKTDGADTYKLRNVSLTGNVGKDDWKVNFTGAFVNFTTELGSSYNCSKQTQLKMNNVTITLSHLRLEAFKDDKHKTPTFSTTVNDCEPVYKPTDAIVPIAVGAALAGMVLIVLIGYCIGRRKTRAGYQNMNA